MRVASGCGSRGSRGLAELILFRVHGSDDVCSAGKNAQERQKRESDKESSVLRRVLNGPCTGGHGGQVISKEGPMARKCDLSLGSFQSARAHPKTLTRHLPFTGLC